jgi:WD40 repeat protein
MALLKLNNDDIFISYSRYDAKTYTDGLANELTKKGFSCFTDALGTDAGKEVPKSLITKLKNCSMLVVVGSPSAVTSIAVGYEIESFSLVKGTSSIVLIDFNDAISQAFWQPFVIGLRREREDIMALNTGNPTPSIVSRIEKAFSYRKNKDRLKRYTRTAIAVLIVLMIAIAAASYFASMQLKKAESQQQIAKSLDLANESQAMLQDPKLIVNSVDKAIQSMEIDFAAGHHSLIPDMALRSSLAFLPDLKESKEYPGKELFFTQDGAVIEERSLSDTTLAFYRKGENNPFFETEAGPYPFFAVSNDCKYVAGGSVHAVYITNTIDKTTKYHTDNSDQRELNQVAISPDGRYMVIVYVGEDEGDFDSMEMWDTQKDSIVQFPQTDVNVNSISFSSNGKVLAMGCRGFDARGSQAGVALLWDLSFMDTAHLDKELFKNPYRHQQEGEISCIAPGEDYTCFASSQQSNVTVWKFGTGNKYYPLSYIPTRSTVYALNFKSGMKELGVIESMNNNSARAGNRISAWEYRGYKEMDKWFLSSPVDAIAYDDSSNVIIGFVPYNEAGEEYNKMMYWQTKKDSAMVSYASNFQSEEMLFRTGDFNYVITRADSLHIWNHTHLKYKAPYDSSAVQLGNFNITPDGKWLTWLQNNKQNKEELIMALKLAGNIYEKAFSLPNKGQLKTMEVSSIANILFLQDDKGNITACDLSDPKNIPAMFYAHSDSADPESFKISPQGQFICMSITGYDRNTNKTTYQLSIRETKTGKVVAFVNNSKPINYYSWLEDDRNILFNYNDSIQVLDIRTNKIVMDIYNSAAVSAVSLSNTGKYIGYGTENGNIRIIETSSLSEVARIKADGKIVAITFNNDDRYFATFANNTSFLDLNAEEDNILSSWALSPTDLIQEAEKRVSKINQ